MFSYKEKLKKALKYDKIRKIFGFEFSFKPQAEQNKYMR